MSQHVGWRGAHVFYHEVDLDPLILDAVRPLFSILPPDLGQRFFVRHWQRGPHVRLWFRVTEPLFDQRVRPALEAVVGGYLTREPSGSVVDEKRLRPLHQLLARLEEVSGPLFPLMANNSIHTVPYQSRAAVLGGDGAAQLIEQFYAASNELVFAMLEAVRMDADRLWLALSLMFAHAELTGNGIERGFVSYRSHAEGFLLATSNPLAVQARLEASYERQRDRLDARLREVLAFIRQGTGEESFIADWRRLLSRFTPLCEAVVRHRQVRLPGITEPPPERSGPVRDRLPYSPFHSYIADHQRYRENLYGSPGFHTFRLQVNLLYLHLARIGVAPRERYALCHLAASAVERYLGVTALELISAAGVELAD